MGNKPSTADATSPHLLSLTTKDFLRRPEDRLLWVCLELSSFVDKTMEAPIFQCLLSQAQRSGPVRHFILFRLTGWPLDIHDL